VAAPYGSYTSPSLTPHTSGGRKKLKWGTTSIGRQRHAREDHASIWLLATCTRKQDQFAWRTWKTTRATTAHLWLHALYVDLAVHRDYSLLAAWALRQPRRAPRILVSGPTRSTSTSPCAATTRLQSHALYVNLVVHREYSSPLSRLQRLLRLRRASGCLGMSRGPSRGPSRRPSSATPPRAGSSSTTSYPPRVRVPRHATRLVTRLFAPLIVDYSGPVVGYSASRRLIVDYFVSAACPGASARRVARHAALCAAHRRLLRARRRLLRLAQARRRLLRLRRASGCLGTPRGSSRSSSRRSSSTTLGSSSATPPRAGSSSTTSSPPRVRVPRHAARLITRLFVPLIVDYSGLVVDYFASAARPGASARRAARHAALRAAHRRLLRAPRLRLAAMLALLQPRRAS
jgi:hypothetical protein